MKRPLGVAGAADGGNKQRSMILQISRIQGGRVNLSIGKTYTEGCVVHHKVDTVEENLWGCEKGPIAMCGAGQTPTRVGLC